MNPMQSAVVVLLACLTVAGSRADAQTSVGSTKPLRIGVLNDQNGPFSELGGPGSVLAARMAVEDFGGKVLGRPIEILAADHQNKPDVGLGIARRWLEQEDVSAIVDLPVSSVALAVQFAAKERKKITIVTGAGTTDLVGKNCSPTGFLWVYNTFSLASATAYAVTKNGGDSWFFISTDNNFGMKLEEDASRVIKANGGKVLGAVHHPINSSDFSSYLLQAQASKAKIVSLANGGADTVNGMKQAAEFGLIKGGQTIVPMILFAPDVDSIGLNLAQGAFLTTGFYWDQDDKTRAFSKRFSSQMKDRPPTELQAGVYSAVNHYLKALAAAGEDDGEKVAAKMRELPVNDFMTHDAQIRKDGYLQRDFYLFKVKSPEQSKGRWDYFQQVSVVPGAQVAPPVEGAGCPTAQ